MSVVVSLIRSGCSAPRVLAVVSTFALLDGSGQLQNRDYQISSYMPAACLGDVCRLGLHVLANGVISRCGRSAVAAC
jgi:hypothetical protein